MPVSASGETDIPLLEDTAGVSDTDYTGIGFRYEEKDGSVGLGAEFTPSANYALVDNSTNIGMEFSGTEMGVFARKYFDDDKLFVESGAMLGLGLVANRAGVFSESTAYANLKLAVGSRFNFGEAMFADVSAGIIQTVSPATTEFITGPTDLEGSMTIFGLNVGVGISF